MTKHERSSVLPVSSRPPSPAPSSPREADLSDPLVLVPAEGEPGRLVAVAAARAGGEERTTLRLGDEIGRGPTAVVWRARLTPPAGPTRLVAVKRRRTPDADADRILRSAVARVAPVHHRAFVPIEAIVELDGAPALVSELVDGVDLRGLLVAGPLPPRAVADLLAEVASALDVAHEPGDDRAPLVHGDLQPGNVRVSPAGEVRILDFGVGRSTVAGDTPLKGTAAAYRAPEADLTPAVDVYALGVLAWECLVGEPMGRLSRRRELYPEQMREALRRVDEGGFVPLLAAMLAWNPEARPRARKVVDIAEGLARGVGGASLRAWAREHVPSTLLASAEGEADITVTQLEILVGKGARPGATGQRAPSAEKGEEKTEDITGRIDALAAAREARRAPTVIRPFPVEPPTEMLSARSVAPLARHDGSDDLPDDPSTVIAPLVPRSAPPPARAPARPVAPAPAAAPVSPAPAPPALVSPAPVSPAPVSPALASAPPEDPRPVARVTRKITLVGLPAPEPTPPSRPPRPVATPAAPPSAPVAAPPPPAVRRPAPKGSTALPWVIVGVAVGLGLGLIVVVLALIGLSSLRG